MKVSRHHGFEKSVCSLSTPMALTTIVRNGKSCVCPISCKGVGLLNFYLPGTCVNGNGTFSVKLDNTQNYSCTESPF